MIDVVSAAQVLHRARTTTEACPQLSDETTFDLATAYRIQHAGIELRAAEGEAAAGIKLGLTSRSKMEQVGVSQVIFGRLTDVMEVEAGGSLSRSRYVHPRAEPEVAFRLGRDVEPDEPLAGAVSAVDGLAAALEIIDSRYVDFRFTVEDVVADNASSAAFVLGPWVGHDAADAGLANAGVLLEIDGTVVEIGSTAAILGDARRAVGVALRTSRELGIPLRRGQIVLAGAATAAVPLSAGQHVRATVSGLGSVGFRVED